jgi:hypothetical protein
MSARAAITALAAMICLASATAAYASRDSAPRSQRAMSGDLPSGAVAMHPGASRHLNGEVVVAWNETAYDLAFAEDQFGTFKGVRAFAMMHIAMHDALNAVVPEYEQYAFHHQARTAADPIAAAAQAAHDVLLGQYPGERRRLDDELARWLGTVPEGARKTRGIALGGRSAAAILDLRDGDGFDFEGTYAFGSGRGVYQTTPPWDGFVLQPGFRLARPFGLRSADQFRPPPPPRLDSRAYAIAYKEVKDFGRIDSRVRTAEQTAYAVWWMEFTEGSMNRLARQLVTERSTNLWEAARLFALVDMSMFDGYLATWDSKFAANHWRPYTAIRAAAADQNPNTAPDPTWEPLRTTPPFPEYVSAHSTVCSSSLETLARAFGRDVAFTMETTTAPAGMPTRSFRGFASAAAECADSRVQLGWHFRYSTDAGLVLGRGIAAYVATHHLEPRSGGRTSATGSEEARGT